MSERARPAVLAVLAVVAIVALATVLGIGPLASGSDDTTAEAPTPTPVATVATTTPADAATTPADATATTAEATTPEQAKDDASAKDDDRSTKASSGSGNPLAVISEPNRQAFERSVVKLTNLNQAPGGPTKPMLSAAHTACAHLPEDAKLPVALRANCLDTIRVAKASSKMRKVCASDQNTNCAVAAQRLAKYTNDLVDSRRDYAKAVRSTVPASSCRRQLLPTHKELVGLQKLAKALDKLAVAVAVQNQAKMAKAAAAVDTAGRQSGADTRSAIEIIKAFRTACHLQQYPDFS